MNIHYFLSPYAALLQNMVARAYEVDVNGNTSQVDEIIIPERDGAGVPTPGAGHQVPFEVTFSGLDFVTHEIRLYTAGGTLLHKYDRTPEKDNVTIFDPIRFRIGDGGANTPVAGATAYVNPVMAGLAADEYVAIRTGYGPVVEGVHIVNNVLGGFQLFQPGDIFSGDPAEEWTILMTPSIIAIPVNDSVVGKQFGPTAGNADIFVDVTTAIDYAVTHLRKIIRLAGTNAVYTFSAALVPPVGYVFRITNFGAYTPGDPDPEVHFDNAPLLWGNTTKTSLALPFSSTCEFSWDGTNWNCTLYSAPAAPVVNSNDIFYNANFAIGDMHEDEYTIIHGQNVAFPYRAIGMIMSSSTDHAKDNTVCFAIRENSFTANQFKITMQEVFGDIQNISFRYWLVKL